MGLTGLGCLAFRKNWSSSVFFIMGALIMPLMYGSWQKALSGLHSLMKDDISSMYSISIF